MMLGLRDVYPWQEKVLGALNEKHSKVALKAANGSGKTSMVAASAVVWHMLRWPGSLVVCTAGVYRQVADALWPHLRKMINGLGGEENGFSIKDGEIRYVYPKKVDGQELVSRCIGSVRVILRRRRAGMCRVRAMICCILWMRRRRCRTGYSSRWSGASRRGRC